MIIKQHKLCKPDGTIVNFQATENVGGALKATYLVVHFTAGSSAVRSRTIGRSLFRYCG
ncbi:MAG: hypothetical protein HQ472_04645 [Ignavibacteria bacterium]|nr:hypothetical protein [Ignavibacteria bacterium]